jgi:hypothetical protein
MTAGRQHRLRNGEAARGLAEIRDPDMPATSADQRLAYIAEMVLELKSMAEQANCATLSGLLDLAHSEANLRRRAR